MRATPRPGCPSSADGRDDPPRILVLVPHDPAGDPRVTRVIHQCAAIGRTDVLSVVHPAGAPEREYDGRVYLERTPIHETASRGAKLLQALGLSSSAVVSALWRRARAVCIVPRVVVARGVRALSAAVKLKRLYGCPVVYDRQPCRTWAALFERRLLRQVDVVIAGTAELDAPAYRRAVEQLYHRGGG